MNLPMFHYTGESMNIQDNIPRNFVLPNQVLMPCIGYGTWKTPAERAAEVVKNALECGYRHIDTAEGYENEHSVGEGIRQSGIPREQVFITSKLKNSERGYETTLLAFEQTLKELQTDYLDLFLIHWPAVKGRPEQWQEINRATWAAFEKIYSQGLVRAIGVSNFLPHHLEPLIAHASVIPMVNQIEIHPGQLQYENVEYCRMKGIQVEAWSPLGSGLMLENPELIELAGHYGITVAQLCVRWCLQHGIVPLPKSLNKERTAMNLRVFNFTISAEDMKKIDAMPYCGGSGLDPDKMD